MAVGRAGTWILHITTTALIGWAMARVSQKGSYLQLGLIYLSSAGLHGLWNALSIFWGMSILIENTPEKSGILAGLVQTAPVALVFLALFLFSLLWVINRRLQQPSPPPITVVCTSP